MHTPRVLLASLVTLAVFVVSIAMPDSLLIDTIRGLSFALTIAFCTEGDAMSRS
jgi:hypothetical protein